MLKNNRHLTDIIKFVTALIVVQGHLWQYYTPYNEVDSWLNIGSECVGLFLFFSGYGLQTALSISGEQYINDFLTRRTVRVIIPLITAYAITLPVYQLFVGEINWKIVIATIDSGASYLRFTWYVSEIIILYILFWASAKIFMRYQQWILTCFVLCLFPLFIITERPIWWFTSLPCFLIGIWYQKYESKLSNIKSWMIIACFVVFLMAKRWSDIATLADCLTRWRYQYIAFYIADLFFVCMIVGILSHIKNQIAIKSQYSAIIHSYYEIYLMQNCCFIIMSHFCHVTWCMMVGSLILVVTVSVPIHKFNTFASSLLLHK